MRTLLRTLRLLSIVLWVGGIAFFAFVVAPVAFGSLPSPQVAGIVVRGTILILHRIGLVCGVVFLLATAFLPRSRNLLAQSVLLVVMLLTTAASQYAILPPMDRDRAEAHSAIDDLPLDDPIRLHFERLHVLSERLEGVVLLLGLAVIILMAAEAPRPTP